MTGWRWADMKRDWLDQFLVSSLINILTTPFSSNETDLFIFLQSSLFFSKLDDLFVDVKTLASPDGVHVFTRYVLAVRLLAKVQILFFSRRHPERINVDHLQPIDIQSHALFITTTIIITQLNFIFCPRRVDPS